MPSHGVVSAMEDLCGSGGAPVLESFNMDRKKVMENVLSGAALCWQELMNCMT